jgi:hypothetical protein
VWIRGQQCRSAGTALWADGPGIASRQPRQVGDQFQRIIGKSIGDFDLAQQLEVDVVQKRPEQFAQPVIVDT